MFVTTAKEDIWIKSMLKEFNLFTIPTMTFFYNNQSCMKLVDNPKMSDNIHHVYLQETITIELVVYGSLEMTILKLGCMSDLGWLRLGGYSDVMKTFSP